MLPAQHILNPESLRFKSLCWNDLNKVFSEAVTLCLKCQKVRWGETIIGAGCILKEIGPRFSLSLCFGNPPTLSVLQKPTCRCIDTVENGRKCQLFARRLPKRFCGNHPPTQKVILQESHLLLNPGSGTLILSSAQCGTVSNEPLLGNCNARALSVGFMDTGAAP